MIKHLDIVLNTELMSENTLSIDQIDNIINGTVQNISCLCIDQLAFKDRAIVLSRLINKLCLNGILHIKMINLDLIANKVYKKELTGNKYSTILPTIQSTWDHVECMQFLDSCNNIVEINGMYFDHIYTVLHLKKI